MNGRPTQAQSVNGPGCASDRHLDPLRRFTCGYGLTRPEPVRLITFVIRYVHARSQFNGCLCACSDSAHFTVVYPHGTVCDAQWESLSKTQRLEVLFVPDRSSLDARLFSEAKNQTVDRHYKVGDSIHGTRRNCFSDMNSDCFGVCVFDALITSRPSSLAWESRW